MYCSLFAVPAIAMAVLAGGESTSDRAAKTGCEQDRNGTMSILVEEDRVLEDGDVFESVNDKMTLHVLVTRLGPASRDAGSGLYILIWESRDGARLRASSTGMCDRLMSFEYSGKRSGR